jgi:hypothetical protein
MKKTVTLEYEIEDLVKPILALFTPHPFPARR